MKSSKKKIIKGEKVYGKDWIIILMSPMPYDKSIRNRIDKKPEMIFENNTKPAGLFSPKHSRILPQKGTVSTYPAWLKKFEPTVTQNPMTIRRFFIIEIEKYLGKESNSKRCVPSFRSCWLEDKLT
ncbi:hypothetical protein AVEN_156914-1 [Araneus ventricosus]|uniref:Uncharacterized protein n=1 Tax=Araneus ventricosus TaxID=182803 RepID=A0A4Y2EKF0_ARAVE|nr:hypothetical protein AVEN_156914-1 [Araneus ventricosus]